MSEVTSEIFQIAEQYINDRVALDPDEATALGIAGYDHLLTDYSPVATAARTALDASVLDKIAAASVAPSSEPDRIAAEFITERLATRISLAKTGEHLRHLSVLACPITNVRMVFTLMATDTDSQWANIAARMHQVPIALASARAALQVGLDSGLPGSARQAVAVAKTAAAIAGRGEDPAWFEQLAGTYHGANAELASQLAGGGAVASTAYGEIATWLGDDYAPAAAAADGVGEERYRSLARLWLGADIDPVAAYDWGWGELGRILARAMEVAERIAPHTNPKNRKSLKEVSEILDADPKFQLHGVAALREWLQAFTDEAMTAVSETCFDIPQEMRVCEAMIAPPGGAAAMYYTPPSEDFVRPGRTWYPTQGKEVFSTWSTVATWYHESVPGHHLQLAYAMLQRDRLSRVQRVEFISAHAEGWALYAERLMGELGFYTEPAYELGMLAGQALRAARVVVDIGLHLGLVLPDNSLSREVAGRDAVGKVWSRDLAVDFLVSHALQQPSFAASEVDRYLGLPAQAISYKLGERAWLQARDHAKQLQGEAFDLRKWHMRALALGPLGLDTLVGEIGSIPAT